MISNILDRVFGRRTDDPFLTLMAVAQEDGEIGALLVEILDQEPLNRRLALEKWISDLQAKQAPLVFTSALAFLLDDATAKRALQLLTEE
jgi:hypothetical protein